MNDALSEAGISAGPRTLQLMPADRQAGLDPYMAQIVGYRKSGLSLNHIIGCPLDCGYCVRHFWGNFDVKTPQLLVPTDQAISLLTGHPAFRPHVTPVQLFNKATDPFLPGRQTAPVRGPASPGRARPNQPRPGDHPVQGHRGRHGRPGTAPDTCGSPCCSPTPASPTRGSSPIAKSTITLTSLATACQAGNRTEVILYWRPIVPGWNDEPATMAHVLDAGRDADAIVFTGYYHKERTPPTCATSASRCPTPTVTTAARSCPPTSTPRSSPRGAPRAPPSRCSARPPAASATPTGVPDYNGHWGVRELCDICPPTQQRPAAATPTSPPPPVSSGGPRPPRVTTRRPCSTTATSGRTASANSAATPSSTTLGFQVWELDQPHFAARPRPFPAWPPAGRTRTS